MEREGPVAVDGGHYCPLGVELTEGMTGEVNLLQELTDSCVVWYHRIFDLQTLVQQL